MEINLITLANRFTRLNYSKEKNPDRIVVFYENDNSVGNRYIRYKTVSAYRSNKNIPDSERIIDKETLYKETCSQPCVWGYFFDQVYYGLIVGPKTLAAIEECIDILKNDKPPEEDSEKVKHVNRYGGVNYISKSVKHDWELTERLGNILSSAFFDDRKENNLYSQDYVYTFKSYSGWSRSC